ncbi:hypothetical protein HQN90_20350 [Paenibacillus alba]|uniref:hypothetical protein n=1 Tax=Paenibacillus alba TaxID=1197127 RepID=UPI001566DF26|nr:hypothetical protein [Paenibacillus alba]NQX68480.1 hypothetical protein [Paenibacillus alba]
MKLIIMLVSMASATDSYQPDDLVKVSDEVAEAWIEAGYAKLYEEVPVKVANLEMNNKQAEPIEGLEQVSKGVYRLPNGEVIHGKKKAEEALQEYLDQLQQPHDITDGTDLGNTKEGGTHADDPSQS